MRHGDVSIRKPSEGRLCWVRASLQLLSVQLQLLLCKRVINTFDVFCSLLSSPCPWLPRFFLVGVSRLRATTRSSSAIMEALRRKKDFVGGTVGGALAGMAYGVTGATGSSQDQEFCEMAMCMDGQVRF